MLFAPNVSQTVKIWPKLQFTYAGKFSFLKAMAMAIVMAMAMAFAMAMVMAMAMAMAMALANGHASP